MIELATKLDFRVTDFEGLMPKPWLKTAVHTCDEFTNQYTFYQLKLGSQYLDIRRQVRDHQDDAINLIKMAYRTVTGMLHEGRHHFD